MPKVILITGATDGIGLETAKLLAAQGHQLLLHGRNPAKLETAKAAVSELASGAQIETYVADFSSLEDVAALAKAVRAAHEKLDVVINNAGVFKTSNPTTTDGSDVRFVVNTIAPYLLTKLLLPCLGSTGRVVNLSSAAQAPVDLQALQGNIAGKLDAMSAYAQSKLAITMWTKQRAVELGENGPVMIAVNPGSLLASKMVKEGFGVAGHDLSIGAKILIRAAFDDDFADATGKYYDNDNQRFANPHADALDAQKCQAVVDTINAVLAA